MSDAKPGSAPGNELALPAEITDWIESETGRPVADMVRIPGGGTREGWFIDLVPGGSAPQKIFLRYSPQLLPENTAFHTLRDEADVVRALGRAGQPVPQIYAAHPTREAVLMERVSGSTWFSAIRDADEQVDVARDFIAALARMHSLDPATLGITGLGPVKGVREHALDRIADIRRRATAADGTIDPLVKISADWLEANVPAYNGRPVLVQGDTGPGNFLYEDRRVTAVLDWELCHWGDPMDDIAWLSLRTVQDTFTHLPDRLAEYSELSGHEIDIERVWYYRVFAETTMATLNSPKHDAPPGSRDIGNSMIYEQLHKRLWVDALNHVMRLELSDVPEPSAAEDHDWGSVYVDVLGMLRTIAARADDPLAVRWTKGTARAVQLLQRIDQYGRTLLREDAESVRALLGLEELPEQPRERLGQALQDGEIDADAYVRALWIQVRHQDFLMQSSSGALGRRGWPPLVDKLP